MGMNHLNKVESIDNFIITNNEIEIYKNASKDQQSEFNTTRDIKSKYTDQQLIDFFNLDLYFILNLDGIRDYKVNDYIKTITIEENKTEKVKNSTKTNDGCFDDLKIEIPTNLVQFNYRKRILKYHPDISKDNTNIFLAIKKAYSVFNDSFWKKKYDQYFIKNEVMDSIRNVINYDKNSINDDFISFIRLENQLKNEDFELFKDEKIRIKCFLSKFNPVYLELSKFSSKKPIPLLNSNPSIFYNFWNNFNSKRSFDFLDYNTSLFKEERELTKNKTKKNNSNEFILEVKKIYKNTTKVRPKIKR